jgi:hypothetical protein
MKTITPKNALKLFLFLLILFSAKAFSFTKLPNEASSAGSESRFGGTTKVTKATSNAYASSSKGNAAKYGNKRFKK